MNTVRTVDGVEIYYKDWGDGQPIVFSHGWPLSADDWDAQMLFFLGKGYRVIAHDRRGHGRSTQVGDGHDMDHYADDLAAVTAHLDLKNAIHVGHSTGGGEVVHYLARHGESRVAKAAIISAVPPLMVKTATNPGGLPKEVFDGFQAQLAANRSEFYRAIAAGSVLQLRSARRETLRGYYPELVAAGHDGRRQGPLRRHRRLLADRFHRRSPEDQCAGAGDAQRRRSDRSLCRCRPAVSQAAEERHAEDLQGFPARHADHRRPKSSTPIFWPSSRAECQNKYTIGTKVSWAIQGDNSVSPPLCLCCIGAGASAAAGGWLTPREAFAEARGIVSLIKDSAAVSPIVTHKLRNNITVLEGSGGTIAVLAGPDGKVLIDAGIAVSRPQMMRTLTDLGADPITHLINTHWHFDHTSGNTWLNAAGAKIIAQENTRKYLSQVQRVDDWDYNFLALPTGRDSQRSVRRGAYPQAQRADDRA